jgi:hypothetical protein
MMAETAEYRYFTTDLLTNNVLAEIPFRDVSWSRAVRNAGSFEGEISVITETSHLDIYNSTMPGKTGLYVLRNGVCVWGGIIWSREYTPEDRTLSVSASEFTSYLYHRFVWKTLIEDVIGTKIDPTPLGSYSVSSGVATFTTRDIPLGVGAQARPHNLAAGDEIFISNFPLAVEELNGGYTVLEVPDARTFRVLTDLSDQSGVTNAASVQRSIDNYRFVRTLINRLTDDFAGISITRDDFHPGREQIFGVVARQRTGTRNGGIARLTVDGEHGLIEGQEVVVKDVGLDLYNGRVTVTGTPTKTAFEYAVENTGSENFTVEVPIRVLNITSFGVTDGVVEVTTSVAHSANVGDTVDIDAGLPRGRTTLTNPDVDFFDERGQTITAVVDDNTFQYTRAGKPESFWYFQRNIIKSGLTYTAPNTWTARLQVQVDNPHNYVIGSKVKVTGLRHPFFGEYTITATPSSTEIEFEVGREFDIKRRVSKGFIQGRPGVVFITTDKGHGFNAGDQVQITGYGTPSTSKGGTGGYNGTWEINQVLDDYTISLLKRDVVTKAGSFSEDKGAITVASSSGLVVGMKVEANGIKPKTEITAINGTNITISTKTDSSLKTVNSKVSVAVPALTPTNVLTVSKAADIDSGMLVECTNVPSDATVVSVDGNKVVISEFTTGAIAENTDIKFKPVITFTYFYPERNGIATDADIPANAKIKNVTSQPYELIERSNDEIITQTNRVEITDGGTVTLGARAYVGTYGGYAYNADIGIAVAEEGDAGVYRPLRNYIGSNLQSVGELLEELSAGSDGFEYRIDCDYDSDTGTFSRTLVLSGYAIPDRLEEGEVASLSSLGADKYVFQYPGNISDFTIEESAEEAATRMWVTGSGEGMSGDAKQPMAAATETSMLESGWPLLDATEQLNEDPSKNTMYLQASSFLAESLPPIDSLTVTVNASEPPYVGSYQPGDWCSLIFEDEFMRLRLASKQEVRDNIFVRKILNYRVDVPDAVGFPESVDLELIRDTEVDGDGN